MYDCGIKISQCDICIYKITIHPLEQEKKKMNLIFLNF